MRPSPVRRTATVAALLVALGGCGGASTEIGDLPADAVFLTAVDRSTDISTLRVEYDSTSHLDGELVTRVRGEATFAPGAAALSATMEGMFGGDAPDAPAVVHEMRFVDGTMYVQIPPERRTQAEPDLDGVEWIAYDLSDGDGAGLATQLEQLDFAATLQALRDSADVTADGQETIAGVQTTRYVGTTTLRALMRAQGYTEEQLDEQVLSDGGPDLDSPMPLTVWIDGDGLVRRYDYAFSSDGFETTQSMTVLEYGPEVDITAPPADATISAREFGAFLDPVGERTGSDSYDSDGSAEFEMEVEGSAEGSITVEAEGGATAEPVPAPRSSTSQPTGDGDS